MNRRFRLSTALDVDDLLMECIPYAIRLANEKYHFDPPLTIYEAEMTPEEKNGVSHRGQALRIFYEKLKEAGYADQ